MQYLFVRVVLRRQKGKEILRSENSWDWKQSAWLSRDAVLDGSDMLTSRTRGGCQHTFEVSTDSFNTWSDGDTTAELELK